MVTGAYKTGGSDAARRQFNASVYFSMNWNVLHIGTVYVELIETH